MSRAELQWATIAQLRHWLAAGDLSSVELTGHLLSRIAEHDGRLNTFIHVADDALDQARASDRRRSRNTPRIRPLEESQWL